jgi:hypothetical protein
LATTGGISSRFSHHSVSLSFARPALLPSLIRSVWPLLASTREIGGVIINGVVMVSGVASASPLSSQACASAGRSALFESCTVISFSFPG